MDRVQVTQYSTYSGVLRTADSIVDILKKNKIKQLLVANLLKKTDPILRRGQGQARQGGNPRQTNEKTCHHVEFGSS